MTIPDKTHYKMDIADPVAAKTLKNTLALTGLAEYAETEMKGCLLLCDEAADPQSIQEWAQAGGRVVRLRLPSFPDADAAVARLRVGAVLAQIRQALSCDDMAASGTLQLGPFMLDIASMELQNREGGAVIVLTEKERDILLRLAQESPAPVARKTLLEDVWGYGSVVETHTLETHIYRLRQKIEADPAVPTLLVTEGSGYCLPQAALDQRS